MELKHFHGRGVKTIPNKHNLSNCVPAMTKYVHNNIGYAMGSSTVKWIMCTKIDLRNVIKFD